MSKDELLAALRKPKPPKSNSESAPAPSKSSKPAALNGKAPKGLAKPAANKTAGTSSRETVLAAKSSSSKAVPAKAAASAFAKPTASSAAALKTASTAKIKAAEIAKPAVSKGKSAKADPKTKVNAKSLSVAAVMGSGKSKPLQETNPVAKPPRLAVASKSNDRPAATRAVSSLTTAKPAPKTDREAEVVAKKKVPNATAVKAATPVTKAAATDAKASDNGHAKVVPAKETPDAAVLKPRVGNRTFPASPKKPAPPAPVPAAPPISAKSARIRREMALRSQRALQNKDISSDVFVAGSAVRNGNGPSQHSPHKDRVVLLVRDSYWLQADWEVTRAAVERIRVAMAEKWHAALPVLRLMAVADASANRSEQIVRDIPIHGGISSWYIDVDEPPSRYRVVVGYVADNERFFPICRSNVIETPRPGSGNRIDEHWRDIAEDYERIYSLSGGFDSNGDDDLKEVFEERLKRPMPTRGDAFGAGSDTDAALDRHRALPFEVDAELIIYGSTVAGATVMLGGEPVKLRPDGSFTIRLALPDKRQVFPVIAQSRDGMRQRTTVVAVERNTKVMEAVDRDSNF